MTLSKEELLTVLTVREPYTYDGCILLTTTERKELRALIQRQADEIAEIKQAPRLSDEEWRDHFLPVYYPKRLEGLPADFKPVPEAQTGTLRPAIEAGLAAVAAHRTAPSTGEK